jgi:hypothetical protein
MVEHDEKMATKTEDSATVATVPGPGKAKKPKKHKVRSKHLKESLKQQVLYLPFSNYMYYNSNSISICRWNFILAMRI